MTLSKSELLEGLLQHNYFPSQTKNKEEMPPLLNTIFFSTKISTILNGLDYRKGGYDQVEYKLTRYNNVPRPISIPHPLAYAKLCHSLFDNWNEIEKQIESENSMVKPKKYRDGRIIIMDYERDYEAIKVQIKKHIDLSLNKKFIVYTDISNFYPSIYSHSIPWALVGFAEAKLNQHNKSEWYNQIDTYQMIVKRNETNGIPIGPASSNIISEIILTKIDKKLRCDFEFIRFVDDYTAFCTTFEESEKFIRKLAEELSKYKLMLNINKTEIKSLPVPSSPEWVADVSTRISSETNMSSMNVIRILDYALHKQDANPDGSVLKYAIKSILIRINKDVAEDILPYVLNLCCQYPILVPLLNPLFDKAKLDAKQKISISELIIKDANEYAINRCSDAMAWSLYYLIKLKQKIPDDTANKIIESKDCISILTLYASNQHTDKVLDFYKGLDKKDLFLLDQYWLLIYQLYYDNKISHPYQNEKAYINHLRGKEKEEDAMKREMQVFDCLKKDKVSFVD